MNTATGARRKHWMDRKEFARLAFLFGFGGSGLIVTGVIGDATGMYLAGGVFVLMALGWVYGLIDVTVLQAGYRQAAAQLQSRLVVVLDKVERPAPPEPQPVSRDAWTRLDTPPPGHGYLYVIRFNTGAIKVGQTDSPQQRMPTHRRHAWAFGTVMTDLWISPAHAGFIRNETRLISFMESASALRVRREYFHGADFDTAVAFAASLVTR